MEKNKNKFPDLTPFIRGWDGQPVNEVIKGLSGVGRTSLERYFATTLQGTVRIDEGKIKVDFTTFGLLSPRTSPQVVESPEPLPDSLDARKIGQGNIPSPQYGTTSGDYHRLAVRPEVDADKKLKKGIPLKGHR